MQLDTDFIDIIQTGDRSIQMNRIRELRLVHGWTQAQLGKHVGAAKSTVSGYETEERQLTPEMIGTLCDLFGCTADYLLGRSDEPYAKLSAEDGLLVRTYHALPPEIRRAVDLLMLPYLPATRDEK